MTTFSDLTSPIKTVSVDTLDMGKLENQESRAIVEILLELADDNLEVKISDVELRTLMAIYMRLWAAAPFVGLRELIESDVEVELFFLDIRDLVVESDPIQRAEMWKEAYKAYCDWVQNPVRSQRKFGVLSVHGEALLGYAQEVLSLEFQWDIFVQKPVRGRQYKN